MIRLRSAFLKNIENHGERTYPEECCGILLGTQSNGDGAPQVQVTRLIAAENQREDESRHNRYLIPPQLILKAERSAREEGLEIVGYYHSHPDHPPRPSEFDREHAWPGTSYIITAVHQGKAIATHSWRLTDDRESFVEEPIEASDT